MITTTRYEARTVYGVRICGFTLRREAEVWFGTREAASFPGCIVVEITERTICGPAERKRA